MQRLTLIALLAILSFPCILGASAIDPTIDRIEEDWQLVISTPDPNLTCPQITTQLKLDSDPLSSVMVFNLNYRDAPSFSAGGLQVKVQAGDQTRATSSQGSAQLQTNGETITWTQRLSLSEGVLFYKVASGSSVTWGNFGAGDSELAVSVATSRTSLVNYSPDASANSSGPGFGSNRLTSMTLLCVRYYQGQTLVSTDTTPRSVNLPNN
jgi:hypothetical protein